MKTLLYSLLIACFIFYSCGEDDPAKPPFPEEIENPDDSDGPDNPDKPTQPDGTQEHPFLLSTLNDLMSMKSKLKEGVKVYFQLENDIDMQGQEWVPLNLTNCQIDFDGKGFTIKNLKCTNQPFASFFGILIGECKNVVFENAIIEGDNLTMGIVAGSVGREENQDLYGDPTQPGGYGVVSNTIVKTGKLKETSNVAGFIGGICGFLHGEESKIFQCKSDVEISGGFFTGAIVGDHSFGALVAESCSSGLVNSNNFPGGISGNLNLNSKIENCYSKVTITGEGTSSISGGIVSAINNSSIVENSYSSSNISVKSFVGGIIGASYGSDIQINNCVAWNNELSGNDGCVGGICGNMLSGNIGHNCFANAEMKINGSVISNSDNTEYDNNPGCYHGKSISDIKASISWDESIWDLSGELPILKWEK